MLKIVVIPAETGASFKLEGRVVGPWADELERVLETSQADSRRIRLDLSAVTFVDSRGARVLSDLVRRGAQVQSASSFVSELLTGRKV